jgi:hypothetical protein
MSNNESQSEAPSAAGDREFIAELKRQAAESRLPPDVKAEILATMPSDEEIERLYREIRVHGGLTSRELLQSLGLEGESQP